MRYKVNNGFVQSHICEAVVMDSVDGELYRYWDEDCDDWLACCNVRMATGIVDERGVEIFEDDIVSGIHKEPVVIVWYEGSFGFFRDVKVSFFGDGTESVFTVLRHALNDNVKVVGNVYEGDKLEDYK